MISLPDDERRRVLKALSDDDARALLYDWRTWARPEQLPPPGDWRTWLVLAGRGWGKALYLGMEIPTPSGWTTMADLRVGDTVFDERGEPCTVTFATEIMHGRPCFDVVFDDGTVIVADAEHQWLTWTKAARKSAGRRMVGESPRHSRPQSTPRSFPSVVTTAQIKATLRYSVREINHSIPTCGPVACPVADLPVEPYVLGAWLGDGDSKAAVLTSADPEVLHEIERLGYHVGTGKVDPRSRAMRYSLGAAPYSRDPLTGRMQANGSLHSTLREFGLLQNKHIPAAYLRASVAQRTALLQGLMDTDGSVSPNGNCEFMSTQRLISEGLLELCLSLGIKAVIEEGRATYKGRDIGPRYRVNFTPHVPVFRLPRKLARQHSGRTQRTRTHHRYIVDVRPRESLPVRCIQVDSPSHLFLCSRSFVPTHNTRTGAEWVREQAERGLRGRMAVIAPTAADARDVLVEGESGILAVSPPWFRPTYEPSKRRLTWSNGAQAAVYSADEPDRLRGPQHDGALCDEVAAWRYPETFDMLMFGLRIGADPRAVLTTTPRPTRVIRDLVAAPTTHVTRGSTYDNLENLAPAFADQIIRKYEGTRLGRQELLAEILTDVPGALWTYAMFDERRPAPDLTRVVVAVDPSGGSDPENDEQGIIVAGRGVDGAGYVLDDRSCRLSPDGWGRRAVQAYVDHHADRIVYERNFGGDMVQSVIQTAARSMGVTVATRAVTASRGKAVRAEPVAALYEQRRCWHTRPFPELEDQLTSWTAASGTSPDRLDALVWAMTDLLLDGTEVPSLASMVSLERTSPWRF